MKIGAVVDVEKGVIQVKNGPKVFSFWHSNAKKKLCLMHIVGLAL